ncbi:hypothetical protein MIND_00512800 [Mycena indigotica]|uniref:Uncharacterized protein n=1 Tax=Mycena indigotica TaxID=2126181 RepID=A0A8H6SYM7_9AGAR|nr:uncharacterized protein MIND_00512800 [Mycena indigotica]KAF7307192.1 hypothetical protein MIND_00512800 [Mycena indigotica]
MFKRPLPVRGDESFQSGGSGHSLQTAEPTTSTGMAETHFPGNSTKTLPSTVGVGRHDGHQDGHLNCIAARHGWTRTFSISPEELAVIDYDTLERILEVNTLRLRPMGLRIFVEQPAESGSWSKVRPWKHDSSLQTILVQKFLEDRRATGTITRFDVRDGSDRRDESDTHSLRSVGSRIVHGIQHPRGGSEASARSSATTTGRAARPTSWFGTLLRRNTSKGKKKQTAPIPADGEDDEDGEHPPEPPAKQSTSTSIFGYLNPLALFSSSAPTSKQPEAETLMSPEETRAAEVENLRKRGWMPPGLAKRQRSLRERLKAREGQNPFLGGSRVYVRSSKKREEVENPFEADATEITPQEVDEFFEIDRTSSIIEMNNQPPVNVKPKNSWGRLKGEKKSKKNKGKQKGELGGGAAIVRNAVEAFPNSPHHSQNNIDKVDHDAEEDEY